MSDLKSIAPIESTPLTATASAVTVDDVVALPTTASDANLSVSTEPSLGSPADRVVPHDSGPTSWFWMNNHDQLCVGVFAAVFLALSGYHWATLGGWRMEPIELERLPARQYDFRIDINSASWVEWTQIEDIGKATAQKIIADREANGPFRSVNDLVRVKGIGPKTLEKMRPFLRELNSEDDKSRP